MSGASDRRWTANDPNACRGKAFAAVREHAQRLLGIAARPPRKPSSRVRLAFLIKNEGDNRRMLVPPAVLQAVRRTFPTVDIELHHAQDEAEDVQVQWLSRTDILVSNIGSNSFRMIYLPDGAQVRSATTLFFWLSESALDIASNAH